MQKCQFGNDIAGSYGLRLLQQLAVGVKGPAMGVEGEVRADGNDERGVICVQGDVGAGGERRVADAHVRRTGHLLNECL